MSIKVLIVDDSRLNIKILTHILCAEGYTTISVNNGLNVVETARLEKPDIILLDIIMPGIDGFEVCKNLKSDFELKDIPVIMVTAKTQGCDVKMALDLGAFDYIKKPLDEGEVIARVQSAIRFKQQHDCLKELAMKDSLTGLYNHALLIELFDKELSKQERSGNDVCFAMIDIDFFKNVNDTYGHMSGDFILKELSSILMKSVRKSDIVGRYGGEEFSIILPKIYHDAALSLCNRIRENVENHEFHIDGQIIHITVSIGICFKNSSESITYSQMIKGADNALYLAKNNGRNRVELFQSAEDIYESKG